MDSIKLQIPNDREFRSLDTFFVLLLAVSPLLQHYEGIFVHSGMLALVLAFPYLLYKLCNKPRISVWSFQVVAPIVPFFIFQVVDHGTDMTELMRVFCLMIYVLAFASDTISSKLFIRISIRICCLASALIILQYFCYYVLGFHLQLVPTSLLLKSAAQWIELAKTGRVGITGKKIAFYRPSAFFLEPSHMFLYMFPALYYVLLDPNFDEKSKRKSILLSAGLLLSTSGMGIMVTIGAWILYFAKKGKTGKFSLKKLFQPRNIIVMLMILVIATFMYSYIDFFQNMVGRILDSTGRESVVSGRVGLANEFIRNMKGKDLIVGIADRYASDVDFHMSGFNGTMYKYGIIGTMLSYFFYLKCVFNLKDRFFWIAVVIIIISFFSAHTHALFYMIYYFAYLLAGYRSRYVKPRKAVLFEKATNNDKKPDETFSEIEVPVDSTIEEEVIETLEELGSIEPMNEYNSEDYYSDEFYPNDAIDATE